MAWSPRNGQRVTIPEGIKAKLREEAEETGEPASKTTTLRYHHDLDSRETEYRAPRLSPSEMVEALGVRGLRKQSGGLDTHYQQVLDRLKRAQQERRTKARRNRRASRRSEKQAGYKLPQILVVQEPNPTRRIGGL